MTPMGGRRHKGIGINRAKKKTVLPVAPVIDESESDDEADDEPPAPPAPPLPATEPPPPAAVEAVEGKTPKAAASFRKHLARAKAAVRVAQHEVAKKERKWERVKKTYMDKDIYSRWAERSVVQRVEQRLFRADIELGRARAVLVQRTGAHTRQRCYLVWHRRLLACNAADPLIVQFYQRALARVKERAPLPKWKSMWPGMSHNIWELNRQNYGLALTWGLGSN